MDRMRRPFLPVVLVAFIAMGLGRAEAAANDRVIAGYFAQWGIYDQNYQVTNIPADCLTHVNYAFAQPVYYAASNSGALVSADTYADIEMQFPGDTWDQPLKGNFHQLIKLKQRFPHLKTIISAGGWTLSDDFSDIAASSNSRTTFIESCVAFITNYGFDGIDFDWEFPVEGGEPGMTHRPEDADHFLLLVQALRARLDQLSLITGQTYLITIAASPDYSELTSRYRIGEMCSYLDWINVMTYNFAGPWSSVTGHHSPLYGNPAAPDTNLNIHSTWLTYHAAGVPTNRFVLGIPFYGLGFQGVGAISNGLFQAFAGASGEGSWDAGSFDFGDLRDGTRGHSYVNNQGFSRHWDDRAMAPYLYNAVSNVFITYDDEESVRLKLDYALANGLRGVMFWEMDADTRNSTLQRIIHQRFYPLTLTAAPSQGGGDGCWISWHGWTGQPYAVEWRADLVTGNWARCVSLVDTSNMPLSVISGANRRITLIDTNFPTTHRFYKVGILSTNEPP
jgi:chitinase